MKIAVVSDDGRSISSHFGRATQYIVFPVEGETLLAPEIRDKPARHGAGHTHGDHHGQHGEGHGAMHRRMFEPIADCDVLIARGMGRGAYEDLQGLGIRAIMTELEDAEQAALAAASGSLQDRTDRVH